MTAQVKHAGWPIRNNGSGVKLTAEDAAIFRRFSWLNWDKRPAHSRYDETFDVAAFLNREAAYLLSLNQ